MVDAESLTLDGRRIGARSELASGKMQRIDSLFQAVRGRGEQWKQLHPNGPFDPASDVTVPTDLGWDDGASVLATLALAGYPGHITMRSGPQSVTFDLLAPGPPEAFPEGREKFLQICRSEIWQARLVQRTFEEGASPLSAALFAIDDWRPVTPATLTALVREACSSGCSSLALGARGNAPGWPDALEMIAAVRSARPDAPLPLSLSGCETERGTLNPPTSVTAGEVSVKGALPPDVVTRIIRQNFGRFRMCYEAALRKDPKLAGKVTARLTIDSSGAVSKVEEVGADLPDPRAVGCVLSAFRGLVFPQPEKGSVTVVYPISFRPGP